MKNVETMLRKINNDCTDFVSSTDYFYILLLLQAILLLFTYTLQYEKDSFHQKE